MNLAAAIFALAVVIFAIGFQLLDRIIRRMSRKKKAGGKHSTRRH